MDADVSLWTLAAGFNRWALYALMLLGAGSGLFLLLTPAPPRVRDAAAALGRPAALAAAFCFLAAVGLSGAEIMEGGFDAFDTWAMGAATSVGKSAILGAPAMLLLWCGLRWRSAPLLALGVLGGVAAFLVTGHAATAHPVWLAAPAVALHLIGAAYWTGALYPLSRAAADLEPQDAGAVLTAFSVRALWLVSAIVASGVVIGWIQLAALDALWTTDYGVRLAAKLALFAALVALAGYNKRVLTPLINAGTGAAAARLRRIIRLEGLLIVLVLGAAVSLTLTQPPRTLLQGPRTP